MMVTMKDIAKKAGVSQPTVSAVLRNKDYCYVSQAKKDLIKKVAREMGYVPNQSARNLRGMKSKTIGLVGSIYHVPIHSLFLSHISNEIWKRGYHVMLADSQGTVKREKEIITEFLARGVDAFIISGPAYLRENVYGKINYLHLKPGHPDADMGIDIELGEYLMAKHLIDVHQHKNIAFFCSDERSNSAKVAGYKKALTEAGLKFSDDLLIENGLDFDSGSKVLSLIEKRNVTAFAASNDELALRLMRFLECHKIRVPEDVAVTGFDDLPMCEYSKPSLTSIKQPVEILASKAVDTIMDLMKGKSKPKDQLLIPPQLVTRCSCGCSDSGINHNILKSGEKLITNRD